MNDNITEELTEELTERMNLTEALLFASPEPLDHKKISRFLGKLTKTQVGEVIQALNERYIEGGHSFRIREIADGFQICLLPNMTMAVEKFLKRQRERRLTQAGLETLSVIAYKQPVTKGEIEHIRGVAVDGPLNTLLERKLVTIVGRAEKVGHPLLYGTTKKFLEYFGLKNLKELPRIDEFAEAYKIKKKSSQQELTLSEDEGGEEKEPKSRLKFVMKSPEEDVKSEEPETEGIEAPMERDDEAE
ncbi:MAG: SMC-Scp complex subunit ScpB [candidate division Zixibacteria bacterium]|nr:SMC-Scp complex subunit ScpB [candidate division Zixibacteria bacterium]